MKKKLSIFIAATLAFCMFSCEKETKTEDLTISGTVGQLEAIDLGLSVKWANRNVGAIYPSDYGGYYAWGEIEENGQYDFATYKWYDYEAKKMLKYCTMEDYGIVDERETLSKSDDVAAAKLGSGWRIPTQKEVAELLTKCQWTKCSYRGVSGFLAKGPSGNTIFIPMNGEKIEGSNINQGASVNLWTSTLYGGYEKDYYAFSMTSKGLEITGNTVTVRVGGLGVRAVKE